MTKTIGWNVDTQYDFMRPDGKLYVQGAETIEPNLERITRTLAAAGTIVINTGDWHRPNSKELSDTPDFKTTYPPHCMAGTKGAEYVPATRPQSPMVFDYKDTHLLGHDPHGKGDWRTPALDQVREGLTSGQRNIVLYKDEFSAFSTPFTREIVSYLEPEHIIIYGVATNVCVDMAVQGLLISQQYMRTRSKELLETFTAPDHFSTPEERAADVELAKAVGRIYSQIYVVTDAIKALPDHQARIPEATILRQWKDAGVQFITTAQVADYVR